MSEERSPKSHAWAYVLAAIALPAIYLLSVPPLEAWQRRSGPFPPQLVELYGTPYTWLWQHSPLRKPLSEYSGGGGTTRPTESRLASGRLAKVKSGA